MERYRSNRRRRKETRTHKRSRSRSRSPASPRAVEPAPPAEGSERSPEAVRDVGKALARSMYVKYSLLECLPVESIVNLCLLLRGRRKLIQFDHYLYNKGEWGAILEMLNDPALSGHIFVHNHKNDKLVFTDAAMNKESTAALSQNYLDSDFYSGCTYDPSHSKVRVTRVAIGVIGPVQEGNVVDGLVKLKDLKLCKSNAYVGQLLLMECSEDDLDQNVHKVYQCFCKYKRYVWEIDPRLQVTLEFYSKSGAWEDQPFLKPCACAYTS